MATFKIIYVKSKILNYYGLAGFSYEYEKLIVRGEAMCVGSRIFFEGGVFENLKAVAVDVVVKQEYQEATGDYSCDDVEFLSEPNNETYTDTDGFDAKLDRIPFEIAAVLIVFLMVVLLCTN